MSPILFILSESSWGYPEVFAGHLRTRAHNTIKPECGRQRKFRRWNPYWRVHYFLLIYFFVYLTFLCPVPWIWNAINLPSDSSCLLQCYRITRGKTKSLGDRFKSLVQSSCPVAFLHFRRHHICYAPVDHFVGLWNSEANELMCLTRHPLQRRL